MSLGLLASSTCSEPIFLLELLNQIYFLRGNDYFPRPNPLTTWDIVIGAVTRREACSRSENREAESGWFSYVSPGVVRVLDPLQNFDFGLPGHVDIL